MRIKPGFILTVVLALFAGCNPGGTDEPIKFSITINGPFDNGTISVKGGLREAAKGKTITLTASPDNGFRLASVTVEGETSGGISVSGDGNERTFIMPAEPVRVTAASFVQVYSIYTDVPFNDGTITVKGGLREAAEGDIITLIASPVYFHLTFVTVKTVNAVDGETSDEVISVSGDGNERTFTMPAKPVRVTAASFELEAGVTVYGVTMPGQYYNGYLTSLNGNRYNAGRIKEGDTVTLLIVPDEGYCLSHVKITGKSSEEEIPASSINIDNKNNRLTFTMPGEDVGIGGYNQTIFSPIP